MKSGDVQMERDVAEHHLAFRWGMPAEADSSEMVGIRWGGGGGCNGG